MDTHCETPLYSVTPDCFTEFEIVMNHEGRTLRAPGLVTQIFRAYDGRIGFAFESADDSEIPGCSEIAFEDVLSWTALEEDWEDEPQGGADFHENFEEDIGDVMRERLDGVDGVVTWDELVARERLERMAPQEPGWHENDELVIYLTLAASTSGETAAALATRVGGALWAVVRGSNPERVALAKRLGRIAVDDDRFVRAAAAIDAHEVARVQSSAMFVGLGGGAGTPETLRLLTLLQTSSRVPRFF